MSPYRRYKGRNKRRLIKKLIVVSLKLLVVILIFGGCVIYFVLPMVVSTSQFEQDVFSLINKERSKQGLPELGIDANLELIAKNWSSKLAKNRELIHGNFEQRIASIGYSHYSCGEIIALVPLGSFNLAQDFVDSWIDSPSHYEIMMTASHGYMGVGVSRNLGAFYAVVDFRFT